MVYILPSGEIQIIQYIPDVDEVSIVGDFNNWNKDSHKLRKLNEFGTWELTLKPGSIPIDSKYKIAMKPPPPKMAGNGFIV